jgi:hypothetical protein
MNKSEGRLPKFVAQGFLYSEGDPESARLPYE